ncbi:MAG: hypothetical protein KGL39_52895 [Patescibacteria group bacterium]|nr:hypothetical protein [Patescibacteria group bacterium]
MSDGEHNLLSVFADIKLHLGDISKNAKDSLRLQKLAGRTTQPVIGRTSGSVKIPSSQVGVIQFGLDGPDQGHFWWVRSLTVSGLTPTTVASGRADIFVSASSYNDLTPGMQDWRDQYTTLPIAAFYAKGALPVKAGEKITVVLSSATASQVYVAGCQYEDYEEGALKQEWSI